MSMNRCELIKAACIAPLVGLANTSAVVGSLPLACELDLDERPPHNPDGCKVFMSMCPRFAASDIMKQVNSINQTEWLGIPPRSAKIVRVEGEMSDVGMWRILRYVDVRHTSFDMVILDGTDQVATKHFIIPAQFEFNSIHFGRLWMPAVGKWTPDINPGDLLT